MATPKSMGRTSTHSLGNDSMLKDLQEELKSLPALDLLELRSGDYLIFMDARSFPMTTIEPLGKALKQRGVNAVIILATPAFGTDSIQDLIKVFKCSDG